jgi:translation initiation factor IF-2
LIEAKTRKVFQVAKELNIASPTILEFLESQGYAIDKKHMSPVTQDMYEEIVKKFDKNRWTQYQTQLQSEKDEKKRHVAEQLRQEMLRKILEKKDEKPEKIELPKYTPPTVIEEPEPFEVEEAEPEPTEVPPEVVEEATKLVTPVKTEPGALPKAEITEEKIEEIKTKPEIPKKIKHIVETKQAAKKEIPRPQKPKPSAKKRAKKPTVQVDEEDLIPIKKITKRDWEERGAKRIRRRRRDLREPGTGVFSPAAKGEKDQELEETKLETRESRRRRRKRKRVDVKEVEESIRQTVAAMESTRTRRRHRKISAEEGGIVEENVLRLTEFVSTQELANMMEVDVAEIIRKLMDMGQLISINQRLDRDTIELIAAEYSYQTEFISEQDEEIEEEVPLEEENLTPRHPVVTVMGHVDHGKTSLLDFLRTSSIISTESGGITQHIGAYEVQHGDRRITFLDTPGHEAFTAMRARGAQVTDIVILVVAADDHVMPQTVEAIDHARSARVPIVIAINKIDKPNANPETIKKELADHNILIEEWGGKYQSAEISAKTGHGIDKLLEEVLLAADVLELRANPDRLAKGVVIESMLDKGKGIVATILVQNGTLKVGDFFHCGQHHGRVRAMFDEYDSRKTTAGPSSPVQVVGFSGPPQAGDIFTVSRTEKESKSISMRRQLRQREQSLHRLHRLSLDRISREISAGALNELHLIVKGDVDGSVQAVCDSLMRLSRGEVRVTIVHKGVGAISESDVLLAAASQAVIIGFHVHPNIKARKTAIQENVEIRLYKVIYEIVNDVSETLEGMLRPDTREDVVGLAEIREVFQIPKVGAIAGCFIVNGLIDRTKQVRLLREGTELFKGNIASLKRFKDDAKEVRAGFECGIRLDGYDDLKAGDTLEILETVQIQRKLADVK